MIVASRRHAPTAHEFLRFAGDSHEGNSPGEGAWAAAALICAATLLGAWLVRRYERSVALWLSLGSAVMLVTALTDIGPEVWRGAVESGVPLWWCAVAAATGFLVIAPVTRPGCGCGPDRARPPRPSAVFGVTGTAAALVTHRVIEGTALGLSVSLPVILGLVLHSVGEGLALATLIKEAEGRLAPWLLVAGISPAVGVVLAALRPLPPSATPVLLAAVCGVLLRTAVVGLGLAATKRLQSDSGWA
ncbi:hypothetical protein Q5762_01395 [Streptomyces sp. P9(2023)]|uniref:hypothetical protein n=1 Tax=Streptomyces sp. P9(2023) TaxID=3064394 RepID=UPI0028F3F993|nr:hypothetical protein [Streptomyces sp. P9(2023)]MDT9687022.1 hypothetical protein [Streptomyces sp. P9(2023)]